MGKLIRCCRLPASFASPLMRFSVSIVFGALECLLIRYLFVCYLLWFTILICLLCLLLKFCFCICFDLSYALILHGFWMLSFLSLRTMALLLSGFITFIYKLTNSVFSLLSVLYCFLCNGFA